MSKFLDSFGTLLNSFQIGIGSSGARSLAFKNSSGTATISCTPTANRTITLQDASGTIAYTNLLSAASGGVTVNDQALSRYSASINKQTGTTYTLAATDNGGIVEVSNASAITLTLPNSLPVGFNCMIVQTGAGQITWSTASGATFTVYPSTHTKTAGTGAMISLYVSSNSSGTAAAYILGGGTA